MYKHTINTYKHTQSYPTPNLLATKRQTGRGLVFNKYSLTVHPTPVGRSD
jgi:hypothetical protein